MPYIIIYFAQSLILAYDEKMLTYINSGLRDYYRKPLSTYRRGVWEFQAVIEGEIAPVFQNTTLRDYRKNTLWVFPPDSLHGWSGRRDIATSILVFHFSRIAEELAALCLERQFLSVQLSDEDISFLQGEYDRLYREYSDMGELYSLKSRIAADRLSLMICEGNTHLLSSPGINEKNIVENALSLFSTEMETGINLNGISERTGLSVAHLRRLFHKVKGASPRTVFEEIRMRRARELCRYTSYSFGEVTGACGFAEQSSFSKAFIRYWKKTPTEVRLEYQNTK